jgi:hypothetical protein
MANLNLPSKPVLAATALGVGTAAAGIVWYARKKRS